MATLTSANWTWAYKTGDRRTDTAMTDRIKFINGKLTIVSGSYPAGGVVLPGFQSVGLVRRLDFYHLAQTGYTASGSAGASVSGPIFWQYLATANKMRPFRVIKATGTNSAIVPLVTTAAVAAQTFYVQAIGW